MKKAGDLFKSLVGEVETDYKDLHPGDILIFDPTSSNIWDLENGTIGAVMRYRGSRPTGRIYFHLYDSEITPYDEDTTATKPNLSQVQILDGDIKRIDV